MGTMLCLVFLLNKRIRPTKSHGIDAISDNCFFKVDPVTGDYVRDSNGFCIPAGVNEPGELIGVIPDLDEAMANMYTDVNAVSKKVYILMHTIPPTILVTKGYYVRPLK